MALWPSASTPVPGAARLLGAALSVIGLFGAEFLMPLYLQLLRGRSALEAQQDARAKWGGSSQGYTEVRLQ